MIVIKYKVYTDMAVLPFPPSPSEVTPKFISLRTYEIRKYRCDPRAQRGWLRMDRVIKVYLVQQNMSYVNGSNMQRELAPLGKSHYTSRYSHPTLASRTVALAKWLLFRLLVSFPNRREEKVEDPTWKKWSWNKHLKRRLALTFVVRGIFKFHVSLMSQELKGWKSF